MATYNPPSDLFARQIQSIRDQSCSSWTCFISDDCSEAESFEFISSLVTGDSRFRVSRNAERRGFYRNFENVLYGATTFDYVSLSDQDDFWYPEKISTLLSRFGKATTLVYSDVRMVDKRGDVLLDSYWHSRSNNFSDFGQLFVANTVTGSTALFRAELLSRILPFPKQIGLTFHDHWIALVAMSVGQIGYVDRPLSDYVQHEDNVIGHARRTRHQIELSRIYPTRENFRNANEKAADIYCHDVLRVQEFAREILSRSGSTMCEERHRTARALANLTEGFPSLLWMGRRAFGTLVNSDVTMGAERRLLLGMVWGRLNSNVRRLRRDDHHPD
jgi:glycosyltransferase involved in cell wall biosynthesis